MTGGATARFPGRAEPERGPQTHHLSTLPETGGELGLSGEFPEMLRLLRENCWHPSPFLRPHLGGHLLRLWESVAWARRHFPVHFEQRLIWFHEEVMMLSLPHPAQLMDPNVIV